MADIVIRWSAQYRSWRWGAEIEGTGKVAEAFAKARASYMVSMAGLKLVCGGYFVPTKKEDAFAVLSQRVCLDLVPSHSEAIKLADHDVSHHMRILTG
jgi:hypothetical protein